jgi:Predicted RNA-binding protein containing a PIN domain
MSYLVDGNNVMGQTPGWHRDKANARRKLVEQLAEFARLKKARVTVVFDGEPDRLMPDASAYRGVKVLYGERGSNADARIERLVEAAPNARGLTVVTSDRHLAFLVRARGARVVRSGEFRKQMAETFAARPTIADGEQTEVGNVAEWLRYFGTLPEDEE